MICSMFWSNFLHIHPCKLPMLAQCVVTPFQRVIYCSGWQTLVRGPNLVPEKRFPPIVWSFSFCATVSYLSNWYLCKVKRGSCFHHPSLQQALCPDLWAEVDVWCSFVQRSAWKKVPWHGRESCLMLGEGFFLQRKYSTVWRPLIYCNGVPPVQWVNWSF